jgi:hemolysin activation/secretion protein
VGRPATLRGEGLTATLKVCPQLLEEVLATDCVVGYFSTLPADAQTTQETLAAHQAVGYGITLAPDVQVYYKEYAEGDTPYGSIMWEQDRQIYRVQFPAAERQNLLYMAHEMARGEAIHQTGSPLAESLETVPFLYEVEPSVLRIEEGLLSPGIRGDGDVEMVEESATGNTDESPSVQPDIPLEVAVLEVITDEQTLPYRDAQGNQITTHESHLFTPETALDAVLTAWEADEDGDFTLEDATLALTQEYISQGYITSRAYGINPEPGEQIIYFIEGTLGGIKVCDVYAPLEDCLTEAEAAQRQAEGYSPELSEDATCMQSQTNPLATEGDCPSAEAEPRQTGTELSVNANYIRSRINQVATQPLHLDRLEERLRLLRFDPLFDNIEATLGESGVPGESLLTIRVQEADPIVYYIDINNDATPSLGAEQFELGFAFLNVSGGGDRISASYARSFAGGLSDFEVAYQTPINPMDGTLRFSGEFIRTDVIEYPFDDLGITGNTDRYAVWLRQPLIRTPQEEFALSLGFTHTSGQTFLFDRLPAPFGFGPDVDGVSRTSVFSFGQDYVQRDAFGAWAFNSQFNLGTYLFDATRNPEPIPDGQFVSWQGLAQRVQRIGNDHVLIAQFDFQLTSNSLLASESYTIGGVDSIRGYRQSARSGDNGFRFSVEDRYTFDRDGAGRPQFTLTPFMELGSVWNHPNHPNTIPTPTFLMGTGVGLVVQNIEGFDGLSLRLDYGLPLIYLTGRGNNLQDHGFYFGVNYNSVDN